MMSTNATVNTTGARNQQFSKEERDAFLQKKNELRLQRLLTSGYDQEIANNIVAYAKQHRGYGAKESRHGGDWLCNSLSGVVYGFKYKLNKFTQNEVMLLNGCCLAFLDSLTRLEKGEELVDDKGPVTIQSLIDSYTTPRTTEGRLMYSLGHRCEPIDEAATGRKDFGPGTKANRMRYLCEAIIELLVTNGDTFSAFYHDAPCDDPNNPRKERVRRCRECGSALVQNDRGYWDCRNDKCSECRDENGFKISDQRNSSRGQDSAEQSTDESACIPEESGKDARPRRRQFADKDKARFDSTKYKKGGKKVGKGFVQRPREEMCNHAFDGISFDGNGNVILK